MNKKSSENQLKSRKLSFPSDENLHPWLPLLLDAYAIMDKGVAQAITKEQEKGNKLACTKGCSHCCKIHKDIPIYPLELVGISWYVTEKISGSEREILMDHLRNYSENSPCPFLVNNICSIYPMRPLACRQFNVFGKVCDDGEDPYHTRREDVLQPVKKHVDQAFFIMFPFYGVEKESERAKLVEEGAMHRMVRVLQGLDWKSLAEKMKDFDAKNSRG
jgi:Fe-S-cluster containining protein